MYSRSSRVEAKTIVLPFGRKFIIVVANGEENSNFPFTKTSNFKEFTEVLSFPVPTLQYLGKMRKNQGRNEGGRGNNVFSGKN